MSSVLDEPALEYELTLFVVRYHEDGVSAIFGGCLVIVGRPKVLRV